MGQGLVPKRPNVRPKYPVGLLDTKARLVNKTRWPLACRVHISAQGLECFLYNRTAAYDGIIAQMQADSTRPSYSEDEFQRVDGLRKGDSRASAPADGMSNHSVV